MSLLANRCCKSQTMRLVITTELGIASSRKLFELFIDLFCISLVIVDGGYPDAFLLLESLIRDPLQSLIPVLSFVTLIAVR